jgi:hypothetical protein
MSLELTVGLVLFDDSDWTWPPDLVVSGFQCEYVPGIDEWKNSPSDVLKIVQQIKKLYIVGENN